MRSILLGLLCHEADIRACTHGLRIKRTVFLAKLDHLTENKAVAAIRNGGFEVCLLAICIPHVATGTDCRWHRVVNDDVAGHMKVGDAPGGVNKRHFPALLIGGHDVGLNGLPLFLWQRRDLLVNVAEAIVGIHSELAECLLVFCEDVLVVHLHAMPKHNRVGDLHHGGLQVQREEDVLRLCVLNLLLEEFAERVAVHEAGIEHLPFLQGQLVLQNCDGAVVCHQLDARFTGLTQDNGLLVRVEVTVAHAGYMSLGILCPLAHGVWVPEGILLNWHSCPTVRIALAQHWVDCTAQDLCIAGLDLLLLVVLGILRVFRQIVTL
mmetsp:Transcript_38759/g.93012  ORF Transcript_38759/g.93012 Transcript_38759/m.93012 type:complete len:322 (-) Transcript_38759:227-1192(-)